MMSGFAFQFYMFAALAVLSALIFVTRRSPVPAALWLINVMFALSGLYVMLDAPFVGVIQVLVYAGAIMVVFVFVVMLLNVGRANIADVRAQVPLVGAAGIAGLLLTTLLMRAREPLVAPTIRADGNAVRDIANALFTDSAIAFEVTSIILLVAVIGAVLLAKKRMPS